MPNVATLVDSICSEGDEVMIGQPWRPEPLMGVVAYKTYAVKVPRATHTVQVSCEQADCEAWRTGWTTVLDVTIPAQREAAGWIVRGDSGRRYTEERGATLLTFRFPPGQQCFREHRVQVRPGIYVVRDGDHRGNPTGRKAVLNERAWLDDFGEHQQGLADKQKEG